MALWLVRGGRHGEHEQKFLDDNRVYLTWWGLKYDLSTVESKEKLREVLTKTYPAATEGRISNNLGQIWAFSHRIELKDWVAVPSKYISAKFKGHGMARLIDAVLRAQGYTTHISAPGPDKGIDILAAPGPLGFGQPRICVQVKSGDTPLDRPTLDQLIGVMQNVQAEQGLLVSWGGFKSSIDKEKAGQFFRVRLWDQDKLIEQLLAHYEQLDEELQAELPLKRIWTLAEAVEE